MNCALVTGASRGLGKAIALQLAADHKLHILINYASNKQAAEETLTTIKNSGGSGELLPFNVQDHETVNAALDRWHKENEDKFISVLVNNAGITRDGLLMWMPEKDWDDVLNISLKGFYNVTRYVVNPMLRKRAGRIVNIVSLSGLKGNAGQTNYAAAKGAIVAATKSLAFEVAKRKITVNAVAPGFIRSDMTEGLNEKELSK
ncbi:MAG TPA: SDR family NAD(P)-dependent oxidoreductase, partial [Bacteroidia bacterium]|nr:SDR family NAD(P)-dependent oxidoreductase [Bacteroidia bacterium]